MSRSIHMDYDALRAREGGQAMTEQPEMTPMQLAVGKTFAAVMNHGHGSPEAKAASAEFMTAFDAAHPEFGPAPELELADEYERNDHG